MTPSRYTLRQLNLMVRDAIETALPDEYWVEAELSECREHGGHCYMELIEKDEHSNTPVARASAKCWRQTWLMVRPYFERTTGQQLRAGMKVLLRVYAQYHEAYGFSWIVSDIDPTYTLGDMARRRQEIVRQLKEEGVFDLQRDLPLPLFCQRIAVISAPNAAGYGDFCHQLEDNQYGFRFSVTLFPAIMQGEQVEPSIIAALNEIYGRYQSSSLTNHPPFDVVCILRGGGATADLSSFDTLPLAENVAQFPLPVITGIGHERDESILDMVSHTRVKTPTAAAAFLIDRLFQVWERISQAETIIQQHVVNHIRYQQQRVGQLALLIPTLAQRRLSDESHRIEMTASRLPVAIERRLSDERHRIEMTASRLPVAIERRLTSEKHLIAQLELRLQGFDPQILLRRGYSITLKDGHAVRDPHLLRPGDEVETRVEKGTFHSVVT